MKNIFFKLNFVLLLLVGFFYLTVPTEARAAAFSFARIRYDRMKASTPSSLQITIVPATVDTENKITLIFGSAVVGAGQSATTTSLPAGAIALPGTLTAVGSGTSIVVSGLTDLTVGTTYAFNLVVNGAGTTGVTTGSAGVVTDTIKSLTSGGAEIDSTKVASRYITNDQVVITANVPPTFIFSLSGNTDAFTADLDSTAVRTTSGIGLTVSTNAPRGWTGWVKSTNAALSSISTGESVGTSGTVNATPEACVAGTDCYVLSVSVTQGTGAGALTANTEYGGNGTTTGGTLTTGYLPFASQTQKVSNDLIVFKGIASIVANKAAGSDYTDIWTIIGAGNF